MFKPIEVNLKWTKELAIKASKLYYDYDMRNSSKRYIGWLFIALTQFGIVGAMKHDSFGLLYLSTFLVLYWYYGRWYLRRNMIVRFYNSASYLNDKDLLFILEEDGLHFDDKVIGWNDIYKAIKVDNGVLLQTSFSTMFFEKTSFKKFGEMQRFLEIMKKGDKV